MITTMDDTTGDSWTGRKAQRCRHDMFGGLLTDRGGAIVIKFAITLPIMLGLMGGVIDYTTYIGQKQKLQAAADSASTAAALEMTLIDHTKTDVSALAQSVVAATMKANEVRGAGAGQIQVVASISTDPLQVTVAAVQPHIGFLGGFGLHGSNISVRSVARVMGKPNICVLGLDTSDQGTIELWSKARLTAQNCAVYSNSTSTTGIAAKQTASLSATLICSAGGANGAKGSMTPEPITDCPVFDDPLASRAAPASGACIANNLAIASQTTTLQPGVYCGGIAISGNSVVTFAPGEFVIKDGPLLVSGDASIIGEHVGFYFTGNDARFNFGTNTTVSLKAPTGGAMAGLLFHESREQITSLTHEINSDNARMLLGTIYLPRGELQIDAKKPVADQSAYTAIVVRKMRLYSGPHLILNTNYGSTTVPVPEGIKGIGQPVAIVQ